MENVLSILITLRFLHFPEGEMKSSKCALNSSTGPPAASNAQAALRVSEPEG